jgi:hypothetical protein
MRTFMRVAIVMIGMTGLAMAQAKPETKPGDAKPSTEPKPAGGMAEMKPPQELADMLKGATGNWRCKGQGMDMMAGKMVDMNATLKMKSALGGWWAQASFDSRMGKTPFQFESYTTYDPAAKKWRRVMIEMGGGWATGESAGMQGTKIDWDLTSHGPMGDSMFRDHEDLSDPKAGVKMWGEFSMDKGKTWNKVYEMTCKK